MDTIMNEPGYLGTSKSDEEILKYGDINELRQLCAKLIDNNNIQSHITSLEQEIDDLEGEIDSLEADLNEYHILYGSL